MCFSKNTSFSVQYFEEKHVSCVPLCIFLLSNSVNDVKVTGVWAGNMYTLKSFYQAGMRWLWEILITFSLSEISQRSLKNISQVMTFLRRLYDISNTFQKRCLLSDVIRMSQIKYISEKHAFYVTFLRRLNHISNKMSVLWRLWDLSKIFPASICDFSNIPHKNGFVWFLLSYWNIW